MADNDVLIRLSRAEALVLFEWLATMEDVEEARARREEWEKSPFRHKPEPQGEWEKVNYRYEVEPEVVSEKSPYRHHAEEKVAWRVSAQLESALIEPFKPN
jgi:hypothetical protein